MEIKLALIGDSGVGKTSLHDRETMNRFGRNKATLICHWITKQYQVGETKAIGQFWDTAGD